MTGSSGLGPSAWPTRRWRWPESSNRVGGSQLQSHRQGHARQDAHGETRPFAHHAVEMIGEAALCNLEEGHVQESETAVGLDRRSHEVTEGTTHRTSEHEREGSTATAWSLRVLRAFVVNGFIPGSSGLGSDNAN